jgi:complex III assembly factor LYRM7
LLLLQQLLLELLLLLLELLLVRPGGVEGRREMVAATQAGTRAAVLGGYRRLLRSSRALFRGDAPVLAAARAELRAQFVAHASATEPELLRELLRGIDEAEELLRHNLVQGRINARGNVEVALPAPPPQRGDKASCPPSFEPTPITMEDVRRAERDEPGPPPQAAPLKIDKVRASKRA